jgi:hypothetical protein
MLFASLCLAARHRQPASRMQCHDVCLPLMAVLLPLFKLAWETRCCGKWLLFKATLRLPAWQLNSGDRTSKNNHRCWYADTLHRDLTAMKDLFEIKRFAMFDQFPYTHHVECGVYLQRKPGAAKGQSMAAAAAAAEADDAAGAAEAAAGQGGSDQDGQQELQQGNGDAAAAAGAVSAAEDDGRGVKRKHEQGEWSQL